MENPPTNLTDQNIDDIQWLLEQPGCPLSAIRAALEGGGE